MIKIFIGETPEVDQDLLNMKKSDKKKIEEFIRVDHAGERGAIKIYEGQLLALNTFVKDDELKKTIEEMKEHEREHANYFEQEIRRRRIRAGSVRWANS